MIESVGGVVHSVEDAIAENKTLIVAQQKTCRVGKLERFLEVYLLSSNHLVYLD